MDVNNLNTDGIKDKVVIITGASSGLGEATAKRLAKGGARLVLGARREDATAPACVETAAKLILRRLRLVLRSPLGAFGSAVRAAPAVRASVCHRATQWISLWRRRRSAAASSVAQLHKLRYRD